jgi:hypothetical protein
MTPTPEQVSSYIQNHIPAETIKPTTPPEHIHDAGVNLEEPSSNLGSDEHRAAFLNFFNEFFVREYDVNEGIICPITLNTDLVMDLYMDPLGLINLAIELSSQYPQAVMARFGVDLIPFDFIFEKMTVGSLYDDLFAVPRHT